MGYPAWRTLLTAMAAGSQLCLGAAMAQEAAPVADAAAGLRILADRATGNCAACHALPGQTGTVSNFGPPLAGVASRYDAARLRQWVTDARQIKPDTLMPPFGTLEGTNRPSPGQAMLTDAQIAQVVAALQTFR